MDPTVSPNQAKKPENPFWKNPAAERPISFGRITSVRLEIMRQTKDTSTSTARVAPFLCRAKKPSNKPGIESGLHVEVLGVLFLHEAFEEFSGAQRHAEQRALCQDDGDACFFRDELREALQE